MGRGSGSGSGRGRGSGNISMPDSLDDLDDCTKGAICCACVCILVTIATLIGVSFKSLEPNEVGLRFNQVSMNIDREERWDGGRHFVGVGNKFIKYPRSVQTVEFSEGSSTGQPIQARTQDGLPITLGVSFNYRIQVELGDLLDLYFTFGEMEEVGRAYNRIAREVVREVAGNFTAFVFFSNRTLIEGDMQLALTNTLLNARANLETFELLEIDLPERFEEARVRQLTAFEEIQEAENDRRVAEREATTRVTRAQEEARSFLVSAEAYRRTQELRNSAAISSLSARYRAEEAAFRALADQLGLTGPQLLSYIWLDSIADARASGKTTIYNVEQPGSFNPVP